MSVSFEKRPDGTNRRQTRAQKEQQEKKKFRTMTITVIAVLAVLFIAALFINSKFMRRTATAMTIGGVNFTAVDFDYFFNNAHSEYQNYVTQQMGDYASQMLPTNDKPLSSQIYDQSTGETWAEFFTEYSTQQMAQLVQYYNAAKAAGYTLPDDDRNAMENVISSMQQAAAANKSQYPTFDSFLQNIYGSNINEKSLRKIMEFIYTANSYSTHVQDSFTYSEDDLVNYYADNKDTLDIYTYRYFLVNAATVQQSDYPNDDDYQAAKDAALADASAQAAQITSGIKSEDDFIAAALAYDSSSYQAPDSTLKEYPGSYLGNTYGPWMQDSSRKYGDVTTADMTNGTYVVFYISRDSNQYNLAKIRKLQIKPDAVSADSYTDGENDPAYADAVAAADAAAKDKADNVYQQFIDNGATEDALAALMADNSDDTTAGGLYDNISKNASQNKTDQEIEDWIYADGRQPGDYSLIKTETDGYNIVYFVGFGEKFCDFLADNAMRNRDYTAWKAGLATADSVKRWGFVLTQHQ